jgi:hypothetical protein
MQREFNMKQKKETLVTPAQYARSRGLNRSTISRQIGDGKIPTIGGLIDPKAADVARQRNLSGARRGQGRKAEHGPEAAADPSADLSRSDLEKSLLSERIKKERLSNRERDHSLVDLAKVNAWVAGMITRAAGILDRIPAELGDRLAQISDPIACQKLLKAEIDRARHELAEYRS